jgi:acyl carrier protein
LARGVQPFRNLHESNGGRSVQTNAAVSDFLIATIARACNLEPSSLSPDMDILELGVDSVSFASMLAQIEANFECEFTPEQVGTLLEVPVIRDMTACIESMLQSHTPTRV